MSGSKRTPVVDAVSIGSVGNKGEGAGRLEPKHALVLVRHETPSGINEWPAAPECTAETVKAPGPAPE